MTDPAVDRMKRDGTADLLKGLAVLLMIQVHIMEQFVSSDTYNSLIGKASMFLGGPPCAPVFLAVMGYFLAITAKPFLYFLKRGGLLFLGGILLNVARSANLLAQIWRGDIDLNPWFFIMGADILTLAGLSLILTGILRSIFKDYTWLYFLTAMAIAAVSPLMSQIRIAGSVSQYPFAFIGGMAEWSYFPLFPWFAYVLTGYSFSLLIRQKPKLHHLDIQNKFIYFIPLWIGVLITMPYALTITHNLTGTDGYYHHGFLFFGWVVLFMVSYLILVKLLDISFGDHKVAGLIKWIGQKVTSLYVIQWLIIGNIAAWLFRSQDLFQFVAWFAGITLATLLTGGAMEKIKALQRSRHG